MSASLQEMAVRVISETDIVAVAASHLGGSSRQSALPSSYKCLFHTDNASSMHVSALRQVFHCTECGAHGSVIDLVMQIRQISFGEAVSELGRNRRAVGETCK